MPKKNIYIVVGPEPRVTKGNQILLKLQKIPFLNFFSKILETILKHFLPRLPSGPLC